VTDTPPEDICPKCGLDTPESLRRPGDQALYDDPSPRIEGKLSIGTPPEGLSKADLMRWKSAHMVEGGHYEMLRRINDFTVFSDNVIKSFQEQGDACVCPSE
jgi:hypothetical protein